MVMGRPRLHDREQIAEDLVAWAQLSTSINMNGFCATRDPPLAPSFVTNWAREDSDFRAAYDSAKAILGMRREQRLSDGSLHLKAYDLNAKVYDHFLKEEWKESIKFESQVAKEKEEETEHKQLMNSKFDQVLSQLNSLSETRNQDDNQTSNVK